LTLCFWGVKRGRCVMLIIYPPSVIRLSRQCGILNISHPSKPPQPVKGITFFLLFRHPLYFHKYFLSITFKFFEDIFFTSQRRDLPFIPWVPGAIQVSVNRRGREADHSPPSSAEVKNQWIYTSTAPCVFIA
jgi:hypothetical protein